MRFIFLVAICIALAACSKGLDRKLQTDQGPEKFKESLSLAWDELSSDEQAAFDWAVSNITLDKLNENYKNQTLRFVIQQEAEKGLKDWPLRLKELEKQKVEFDKITDDLHKISANNVEFALERDFHGLKPKIEATVSNDSAQDISSLSWQASLFINGEKKPAATAKLFDNYNTAHVRARDDGLHFYDALVGTKETSPSINKGGLGSKTVQKRSFFVGFVTGDDSWTTLAIQNAKEKTVTLTPIVETVKSYSDEYFLKNSPYVEIQQLQKNIELAKVYKDL